MDVDALKKLLDRYIAETITELERRHLSRLLESDAGKEALEQIIDREFAEELYLNSGDDKRFQAIYAYLAEARKDRDLTAKGDRVMEENHNYTAGVPETPRDYITEATGDEVSYTIEPVVGESEHEEVWPSRSGKRRALRRWRLPAAAIIICLSGWLLYFYNSAGTLQQQPVAQTPPAHDALPGKYGALLTLSDGTQIPLDSATPGRIDIAGSAVLLKEGDQLQYRNETPVPAHQHLYHTLTTSKGEVYSLTLSDGSKVWLNSASSIRFPVAFGATREVAVTGEAYFEVVRDVKKRFLVDAGGVVTEVLGTKFNVNAYADETKTAITLLEGSVKISNETHSVHLRPGQQAGIAGEMEERRSSLPSVVSDIDALAAVAWKDGYFHFNDADLPTVMRQLTRWYDVEVVYTAAIPQRRFGGKMERDLLLSQVLKILEKSEVNFKVEGNRLLVLSNP